MWAIFTVIAAATQTARNALQRELTKTLGTAGATQVRFLYGLPFGLLFMGLVAGWYGLRPPLPGARAFGFILLGAVAQILATALLLSAMKQQSFVITTAYSKTEPVQVALFGLVLLGDALTVPLTGAILVATAGVVLMGWPAKPADTSAASTPSAGPLGGWNGPVALGLASAAMFGLSAVGFRGGVTSLPDAPFLLRASTQLAIALALQTAILGIYLAITSPQTFTALARAWKPSLPAGLAGAFASQCWFAAFALETAAKVRTLGLIEVLFAYAVSRKLFSQTLSRAEVAGLVLVTAGVAGLLILAK